MLSKYSWICGLPLKGDLLTKNYTIKGNCLSFYQKLTIFNSSTVWGGFVYCTPPFVLGFPLAWLCIGFLPAIVHTVISNMKLPCCVQQSVFLEPSLTLGSYTLSAASSKMIHEPWNRKVKFILYLRLTIRKFLSLFLDQLHITVLISIYYK